MPNLLKTNRFTIILGSFSKGSRLVLTFLIFFGIFLVWLFFFYLPLNFKIQKEQLLCQNYLKKQQIYQKTLISFDCIKKEGEKLSQDLEKHLSVKISSQKIFDTVLNSLKSNELHCIQFSPLENKQYDFYKKEYYALKAKGKFVNIISFFDDLEKIVERIEIKNLELERKKHGKVLLKTELRFVIF